MKKFLGALLLLPFIPALAFAQNAAPDPAAGKALWDGNNTQCKFCHGKDGEGAFGPDLAGRGLSASEFSQAVRKPWGIMPAFVDTQLSDADLSNLAAYFASLPKKPDPGPWRYTATDAMPHGQQVFHAMGCAQCHGPTFDMPRGTLGGLNADFPLFQKMVYTHTSAMEDVDASLRVGNPPGAGGGGPPPGAGGPPGGAPRQPPPLRMGNFNSMRVSQDELKAIYDWAHDDIGFKPLLSGRLTPAVTGATGATYTLSLFNGGLKGKGLTAEGVKVDLVVPAGATVVSTTGDGYKGVHMDADVKANVAEWLIPSMAPKDAATLSFTLSKPGTQADNVKGTIRWAKPGPKTGPNSDFQAIAPAPLQTAAN